MEYVESIWHLLLADLKTLQCSNRTKEKDIAHHGEVTNRTTSYALLMTNYFYLRLQMEILTLIRSQSCLLNYSSLCYVRRRTNVRDR